MRKLKLIFGCFSKGELILWCSSSLLIVLSFVLFRGSDVMSTLSSLIGVTSLIFIAKGHPAGQVLMIIFGVFYAIVSFSCAYYGEMIICIVLTLPLSVISLISWLRHPYRSESCEVEVSKLRKWERVFLVMLTLLVTAGAYFLLRAFNTANLLPSTVSVATSFFASYLIFRRSVFFSLAYAANDIVLIVLWTMAAIEDIAYVSVLVCFITFFANDIYGFISWRRMRKRQRNL